MANGNPFENYDDDDDDEVFLDEDEEELEREEMESSQRMREGIQADERAEMKLVPKNSLARARSDFWKERWSLDEADQVSEDDILGLRSVKRAIREIITLVTHWEDYRDIPGIKLPRGLLLYGRPGNGKTMCLRWMITAMDGECFNVRHFPLAMSKESKWTDKDIEELYAGARKHHAKTGKPVILFWDEMDAYVRKDKNVQGKDSVASALCTEMDGIEGQSAPIFLVGTANYTGGFEEALTRAGRLSLSAECVQLNAEDATKMLIQELDHMQLPHPPSPHIEDLLGDGDRSAIEIKEAVSRAKMRAIVSEGELTEESIGRALLEQMIPIPADNAYDKEYLNEVAWHEVGHALYAHALGLKMQRIDVHRVANQQGSIVISERAVEKQVDGFCYVVVVMGGKMMEIHRHGESNSSLNSALEDYRSIVQTFTATMVQAGGRDGFQFDWKSLSDRMDFTGDSRAEEIDAQAEHLINQAGSIGLAIFYELEKDGSSLNETLAPLVKRLTTEGIILGSDAFEVIGSLINKPMGWYRETALTQWVSGKK